jgi:hypothetical protein
MQMTSGCSSLLGGTVATVVFSLSLLSYYCTDVLVATDRLPVDTVTYGLLLQCLIVVVFVNLGSKFRELLEDDVFIMSS